MNIDDAIISDNLEEVQSYFRNKNLSTDKCNAALHLACQKGKLAIVKYLLEDPRVNPSAPDPQAVAYSVNPHLSSNYALQLAIIYGHDTVVNRLLDDKRTNPAAANNRPLELAALYGRLNILQRLLKEEQVDPSANNFQALKYSISKGHIDIAKSLLATKGLGQSSLYKIMPHLKTEQEKKIVNSLLAGYALKKVGLLAKYENHIPTDVIYYIGSKLYEVEDTKTIDSKLRR